MSAVIVEMTVSGYENWHRMFAKYEPTRSKAGLTNSRIFRGVTNDKSLMIVSEVADQAKAREMFASQEFRTAMQEGGVMGPPKQYFV